MVVSCCSVQGEGRGGGSSDKRRISRLIKPFENHSTVIYNSLYQLTRRIFICHFTQIPNLPLWAKKNLFCFQAKKGGVGGNKRTDYSEDVKGNFPYFRCFDFKNQIPIKSSHISVSFNNRTKGELLISALQSCE